MFRYYHMACVYFFCLQRSNQKLYIWEFSCRILDSVGRIDEVIFTELPFTIPSPQLLNATAMRFISFTIIVTGNEFSTRNIAPVE